MNSFQPSRFNLMQLDALRCSEMLRDGRVGMNEAMIQMGGLGGGEEEVNGELELRIVSGPMCCRLVVGP